MLEAVYRAAGLRVGLFTSPHLVSFRERIQVNREPISQDDVVRLVLGIKRLSHHFPPPGSPTFFEVVTVMALQYFAERHCDLVVWETGMGGRLDATNIVHPLASVITNVQWDHQQWLGDTLARIAFEKAGIVKPRVPVLTAADAPEALAAIRERARAEQAPLLEIGPAQALEPPLDTLDLSLLGDHQRLNAALALATVRTLAGTIPTPPEAIRAGLTHVDWAGRLQIVRAPGGQVCVLDGAHNPAGVATLAAALRKYFPGAKPTLLFGVLRDKDWVPMCRQLAPLAGAIHLVPVASPRTAAPADLRTVWAEARPDLPVTACHSLEAALLATEGDPFRVITGSLYLVGQALEALGSLACPHADERRLNETLGVAPRPPRPAGQSTP
jgi:dihydrofolate synthase/folylpolyglutamate synthase